MDYEKLAAVYDALSNTSKRLEKTALLADFLQGTPAAELERVILLLQGRVFPLWDKRVLGLSEKLLVKAIAASSGASERQVIDTWRDLGDIGRVAESLLEKKSQSTLFSEDLTVKAVFDNLRKVASSEGKGAMGTKVKLVAQLLSSAKGVEARYVVRSAIGDLRVGIAEGTLRDAIGWAYLVKDYTYDEEKNALLKDGEPVNGFPELRAALDRSNDFVLVARIAQEQGASGLREVSVVPGKPLKVMLAQKVIDFEEGFERVGKPCAVEYKMDGFRVQVHKSSEGDIRLFTRRLEEVTEQFPDVVEVVRERVVGREFIIDAEAAGYDPRTKKYRPFQDISQRIRRKYDIETLKKKLPVELAVFDILFYDGEECLDRPFFERRALVERIVRERPQHVVVMPRVVTGEVAEAEEFYKESLAAGNEGVMLKKLDAPYQPGSRVGTMIKLKPVMDTLDLVIVGAEWGTGKRSGWLTSYTVACFDEQQEELVTIGRFGTGIKEKEEAVSGDAVTFDGMTERLKPLIRSASGRDVVVRPEVVVEVKFEEIQKSPSYTSGYALRFPRFVKLRPDRGVEDLTTLSMVETAYERQRGRG
ncbi:ATP-dependent DNA ligase [Candidatus Woesearchaeota archaeon]|nr:ATP-dependent DNA ligase [Candidatus Woesearchaeota archaeon]